MARRTGASRRDAVPPDVLAQLNAGTLETATLAEGLAIDFPALLRAAAPDLPAPLAATVRPTDGVTTRMRAAGQALAAHFGLAGLGRFVAHPSDTVRGWAAFLVAAVPGLNLREQLRHVRPLADDPHFGVREWAWLAVREAIAADIRAAVRLLVPWVKAESANVRRFAAESTRPRGVWCSHVTLLKEQPEVGLPLLEPLKADPVKYVQLSVANWLNDAGKSRPEWVREVCERWRTESDAAETRAIVTRAMRNL